MSDPTFGQLTKLSPRDYWANEAADFAPWLAEEANIALLGDAIGLELVEETVGSFNADIICRSLPDEHRAAIDWLNAVTVAGVHFFGVELQVWRIGDSLPAPRFDVVAKPNDWLGTVRSAVTTSPLSSVKQLQLDYWTAFRDYLTERGSSFRPHRPRPQHWASVYSRGSLVPYRSLLPAGPRSHPRHHAPHGRAPAHGPGRAPALQLP